MSQKITYENKVALNENPSIADINKVKDTDMNEIKEVVNGNADVLDTKTQIFQGNTPPENPEDGALWVDTNDEGVIVEVDQEVNSGSTNAVSNSAITNYVNGTVIFEDSDGQLDNITLSKSVANSRAIEIEYVKSGTYGVQKVINPNGKQVTLYLSNWYDTGSLQEIFKKINISGTSITHLYGGYRNSNTSGTPIIEIENSVAITKVISYEEV